MHIGVRILLQSLVACMGNTRRALRRLGVLPVVKGPNGLSSARVPTGTHRVPTGTHGYSRVLRPHRQRIPILQARVDDERVAATGGGHSIAIISTINALYSIAPDLESRNRDTAATRSVVCAQPLCVRGFVRGCMRQMGGSGRPRTSEYLLGLG